MPDKAKFSQVKGNELEEKSKDDRKENPYYYILSEMGSFWLVEIIKDSRAIDIIANSSNQGINIRHHSLRMQVPTIPIKSNLITGCDLNMNYNSLNK